MDHEEADIKLRALTCLDGKTYSKDFVISSFPTPVNLIHLNCATWYQKGKKKTLP